VNVTGESSKYVCIAVRDCLSIVLQSEIQTYRSAKQHLPTDYSYLKFLYVLKTSLASSCLVINGSSHRHWELSRAWRHWQQTLNSQESQVALSGLLNTVGRSFALLDKLTDCSTCMPKIVSVLPWNFFWPFTWELPTPSLLHLSMSLCTPGSKVNVHVGLEITY
jgi:hypothetical protein